MPKLFAKSAKARAASHSGSWYDADPQLLSGRIATWLDTAEDAEAPTPAGHCQAVIAPHAGYSYCGHVMAHAYRHLNPDIIKRIFILGPSHHFYSRQCHISPHSHYETPLGHMNIDQQVYAALTATGSFPVMSPDADEAEHSLELHLPYIMHVMQGRHFTVVPIVVGALSFDVEATYGQLLAPHLADASNFFVISSDFCHWGSRFSYTYWRREDGDIHESIEKLDREGMAAIEGGDPAVFSRYLQQTRNTICGRHPIGVFLQALKHSDVGKHAAIKFIRYDQSQRCTTPRESSVSYASAVVTFDGKRGAELDGAGAEEDVGEAAG